MNWQEHNDQEISNPDSYRDTCSGHRRRLRSRHLYIADTHGPGRPVGRTGSVGGSSGGLPGRIPSRPGSDYRLYLSPKFVETEADFEALKSQMVEVGRVQTFENFMVTLPGGIDPSEYSAAIVWCESFGQFITAAEYR